MTIVLDGPEEELEEYVRGRQGTTWVERAEFWEELAAYCAANAAALREDHGELPSDGWAYDDYSDGQSYDDWDGDV